MSGIETACENRKSRNRGTAKMLIPIIIMIGFLLPSTVHTAAKEDGFIVIVNSSNDASEMSAKDLSKLFLKKKKYWEGGREVVPIDLLPPSSTRELFSETILNKQVRAVRQYWRLRVFGFGDTPPTEMATEFQVLQFVSQNRDAIGYVSDDIDMSGYEVRKLRISGQEGGK